MKAGIDTKIMNRPNINQLYLKDTSFANLMQKRVFNVLLVASRYDAFIMEEDGRVEEQIYFEYVSLNLSSPPRVKQVTTNEEAFEELALSVSSMYGISRMMRSICTARIGGCGAPVYASYCSK